MYIEKYCRIFFDHAILGETLSKFFFNIYIYISDN